MNITETLSVSADHYALGGLYSYMLALIVPLLEYASVGSAPLSRRILQNYSGQWWLECLKVIGEQLRFGSVLSCVHIEAIVDMLRCVWLRSRWLEIYRLH